MSTLFFRNCNKIFRKLFEINGRFIFISELYILCVWIREGVYIYNV